MILLINQVNLMLLNLWAIHFFPYLREQLPDFSKRRHVLTPKAIARKIYMCMLNKDL